MAGPEVPAGVFPTMVGYMIGGWRMERKAASVSKTHRSSITAAAALINMYSDNFYGNVD